MPFRPYHQFQNRVRMERLVSRLNGSGNIRDDVYDSFHRYHPAMLHKLRSAKYHLERLSDKLMTTDIQEAAGPTSDFMFEVNMFIDGFFYNAGSSMDILARVVLALFGESLVGRISFQSAHERLSRSRPGDAILQRLRSPEWRAKFLDYRNTVTHELILASKWLIVMDGAAAEQRPHIVFPLPDDPHAAPADRKYRRNPNVVDYIKQQFRRILTIANTVYGDIIARSEATGTLPL